MNRYRLWGWMGLLGLAAPLLVGQAPSPDAAQAARGRYLVVQVAQCVQCHSPRDGRGQLVPTQLLRGAAMPVRAPFAGQEWAMHAPNIAGLTGFTDEQIGQLLTEGRIPGRPVPLPPMPSYRLSVADADAVIAYLRSL